MSGFAIGTAIALAVLITGYVHYTKVNLCVFAFRLFIFFLPILFSSSFFFFFWYFHYRPVSGGSMNPARSLGPAIVSWKFDNLWIYTIAPTVGAVAGGHLVHLLRLRPQPCISSSSPDTILLSHAFH